MRDKNAGRILTMIEESGLIVEAMRMLRFTRALACDFYGVHKGKPFYDGLIDFMTSGPSVILVLGGEDAIVRWRELMGATNPEQAAPGTIRRLYGASVQHNACHGSDAPETAAQEVEFFFSGMEMS
jgi:nucleoside-diphosphate kinase